MSSIRRRIRCVPILVPLSVAFACAHAPAFVQPREAPTRILRCAAALPVQAQGRTVRTPNHELRIPGNAVPAGTRVQLAPLGGDSVGVRVQMDPPAPRFATPATLLIDFDRCGAEELAAGNWVIWRFYADGRPPVGYPTQVVGRRFSAQIRGNGFFAVAD